MVHLGGICDSMRQKWRQCMATLPENFDKHLRRAINARAVWLPGSPVQIGDIMVKRDGRFKQVGHVADFGATIKSAPHVDVGLDLASESAKQTTFQFGAEVGKDDLDLSAEASVKIALTGKSQFWLKTANLSGLSVQNELQIAALLAPKPNWNHDKFFIVTETYGAADWTFVGSKEKSGDIAFSGKGAGILSLLTVGLSAGLKTSGSVELKLSGKSGMMGMNLIRISENGSVKPLN
jgi:hypothetical protein